MELFALARIQKRIADWAEFNVDGTPDPAMKRATDLLITELRRVVSACWEARMVSPAHEAQIKDLERRLEAMNDEARLRIGGNTPLKKEDRLALH